jgi:outer membrane scaffolding protein for murein synthesis (MipA/OmpV family)
MTSVFRLSKFPSKSGTSVGLAAGLLTLAAVLAPSVALAQEVPLTRGESRWGLGLAVDVQQEAYRDMGNDTQGIPLIYFENYWVRVMGPGVELKLPPAGPVSFRLKARYSLDGYEASDSPALAGMAKRGDGVWIGGQATWHTPFVNLSAELMGDASSHSGGRQFKLQADRRFASGKFSFTPRLAAVHLDQEYVGYYYGVNASEVTPGRSQYGGESTVNLEVGLRIDYALSPKQNVFFDLRSTRLGDGIKDSPLVDRSSQTGLRVGYLYRF